MKLLWPFRSPLGYHVWPFTFQSFETIFLTLFFPAFNSTKVNLQNLKSADLFSHFELKQKNFLTGQGWTIFSYQTRPDQAYSMQTVLLWLGSIKKLHETHETTIRLTIKLQSQCIQKGLETQKRLFCGEKTFLWMFKTES